MAFYESLGHGIGLRPVHYASIVESPPRVGWFEAISENFMVPGGNPRRILRFVRERYPVVLHGVSLSIGSSDPLDERYLAMLAKLADDVQPAWVSDHLCWSSFGGHTGHDLWPLPFTEEALVHVAARVARVQERLRRPILLENVSTYLRFASSTIPEWELLSELARRTGCGVLLDVNNVYVSAQNNGFDADEYIDRVDAAAIGQVHLAGHADLGDHLLDTHDRPVIEEVWNLYRRLLRRCGRVSTLVEWDDSIPPLERVVAESQQAARIETEELHRAA
jgi:uncharacterized protein (UPF0276 family)